MMELWANIEQINENQMENCAKMAQNLPKIWYFGDFSDINALFKALPLMRTS